MDPAAAAAMAQATGMAPNPRVANAFAPLGPIRCALRDVDFRLPAGAVNTSLVAPRWRVSPRGARHSKTTCSH